MKKTKWQLVFILCQFLFMFAVPILALWLEYGNNAFVAMKYNLSITGIVFVLLFFALSKRFWLDDLIKTMHTKIAYIEANALSMTDQKAIETTKKQYKRYKVVDLIVKMIVPLILLVGLTIVIEALEQQALKMYNVFLWSTISFGIGIVFKFLEIKATRFIHEVEK